jgi:hypothetical protein
MGVIEQTLKCVEVGSPQSHRNLTLYPLLGATVRTPDYATLDEAIEGGWLEVSEISAGGSVPELKVSNRGDRGVLMLDGEELRGAKQNRVLNLTILVPAGRTIVVPVSCVEQGRWASQSVAMSTTGSSLYSKAKLSKLMSVSASYAREGRPRSDQGQLWSDIEEKLSDLKVGSDSMAMADAFEQRRGRIEEYLDAFRAVEGQTGAMFAIGSRLVGLELFEHPELLRKMLDKVVRSYALDALTEPEGEGAPTCDAARRFLDDVAAGQVQSFPAVGLGQDLRISGPRVTGAALVEGENLVHLCAFRTERGSGGGDRRSSGSRMRSALNRMRSRSRE